MTDTLRLPETTAEGRARAAALSRLGFDDVTPTARVEFVSRGRCLVIGPEERALAAARRAGGDLRCTVVAPGSGRPALVQVEGLPVVRGGRLRLTGALGDFHAALVGEAGEQDVGALLTPRVERFDLVLDLGEPALMKQAMLPLGYYAPKDDATLEAVLAVLPDMLGEFEKPKFFEYDPDICAHGRAGKRGCTRCIDACPAEAIVSIGERVQVNPYLCQGGGACATACPTGAITYAYPPANDLLGGVRRALSGYREAGGVGPVLLFHDEASRESLAATLAGAMPERVIPVLVEEVASVGLDAWLGALAYGAAAVAVATSDRTPAQSLEALQDQLVTARALLAGMGFAEGSVGLVNVDQDVAAEAALAVLPAAGVTPATFAAPGDKRGRLRLALQYLYGHAPSPRRLVALHPGAPFGEVKVNAEACTLCMSCVSSCPTHALQDGRGLPQLNFREWNCVQCGLCERTCPEDAITLSPRFLYDTEARERTRLLHEEQPLCCISCGKPFATRSMMDVLEQKLAGHWMFQDEASRRRLLMCEDCRVRDLFAAERQKRQNDAGGSA